MRSPEVEELFDTKSDGVQCRFLVLTASKFSSTNAQTKIESLCDNKLKREASVLIAPSDSLIPEYPSRDENARLPWPHSPPSCSRSVGVPTLTRMAKSYVHTIHPYLKIQTQIPRHSKDDSRDRPPRAAVSQDRGLLTDSLLAFG